MTGELADLLALSTALGDPAQDLVILAEGNTSIRVGADRMLVKASGSRLGAVGEADFVEMPTGDLVDLVLDERAGDDEIARAYARAERDGRRPSVEAVLHALCLDLGDATVVGHTHPVAVNVLLCSAQARRLADDVLFPEQVVILGPSPVFVPYADPGLGLARAVHAGLRDHRDRYGVAPKVVYLGNHGMVALGSSCDEVLRITQMAVKVSRVLAGALALGGVTTLSDADIRRIDGREDEAHRRRILDR